MSVQLAVEMVVDPESIETTVDDIGGLDHILERLVGLAECTAGQMHYSVASMLPKLGTGVSS